MILVDTGPLVSLFDPRERDHAAMVSELRTISEPLVTTIPVLTEAVHLVRPGSRGAAAAAEKLRATRSLTLGRSDFAVDRVRMGRALKGFRVLDPASR